MGQPRQQRPLEGLVYTSWATTRDIWFEAHVALNRGWGKDRGNEWREAARC
jgi:hypothetical protein